MAGSTLTQGTLLVLLSLPSLVFRVQAVDERCTSVPNLSYIPSPNACYLYYNCIDDNAYPQVCHEGLWFSLERQGCVVKEESDCTLTDPPPLPEAPGPETSPMCNDVPNFRYVASANSCQWYYQCIDRIAYLLSCPLYYWFDQELQRCSTRYDVQCNREDSTTTMLPTPPTVDPLELCDDLPDFTLVPSASFCDRYYSCYQGNPYPQNCQMGMWFNPDTLQCDDPDNVDCAALTERPPTSTTTAPTTGAYRMVRLEATRILAAYKSGVNTV